MPVAAPVTIATLFSSLNLMFAVFSWDAAFGFVFPNHSGPQAAIFPRGRAIIAHLYDVATAVISQEEVLHWLALRLVPGLGTVGSLKLLEKLKSPQAVFRASASELEGAGMSPGASAQHRLRLFV